MIHNPDEAADPILNPFKRWRLSCSLSLNCNLNVGHSWRWYNSSTFKLQFKVKLKLKRGNGRKKLRSVEWSNTFKLQFKVKLKLKRGNEKTTLEANCGRTRLSSSLRLNWSLNVEMKKVAQECEMSNTFKLQFKLKLELKRGNGFLVHNLGRTRLSSSLSLNWSLNVEMLPGAILLLAFNFQFKVKLEVKRHFQLFSAFMILAFKL
ncbi:uncharacterized protein DS421_4g117850 [Arachis hypogaea]|nr:uncharacterized protein DS421_4g117850 [Arachis hypogaea]